MSANEEIDWIFDFVLQFLESDKFDAAVMDFVDEKCFVFDNDEENKFIYSDISTMSSENTLKLSFHPIWENWELLLKFSFSLAKRGETAETSTRLCLNA